MRRLILLLCLSFALARVTEAQKPPAEVFRVGRGISAPQVTHRVEPTYSGEAFKARLEGSVELYVEVQPDGSAGNIQVSRSLGMGLDERAVEAVQKWKFNPAMKDGKPVAVAALITVHFRLRPWRPLGGPPARSETNNLGGTPRHPPPFMAAQKNQDRGQPAVSQDAEPQKIEFVGALEMLTESAVAVKLSDDRIIEAALTADSDAAQLASIKDRYIGDIVQIRCKPIPRSYNAAEDRPQFLALTGIRFLRGPKQDELAAALKSRHRRNPRNLLRLPDTGETDLGLSLSSLRLPQKPPESRNSHAPDGIGDDLGFIERSRLRIISYLANVPNYIADEIADRHQALSIPLAWTKVDSIRCEVRFNGHHESRQNIFLNNKAWLEPFVMLPGFTWRGGFGEKLRALFDPVNPVSFFFYQRILYKGQYARVYRFNAPKDGIGSWQSGYQVFHPAFEGKVTITEDDGMAVRLESKAIGFPPDFPVSSTEEILVWGWVDAGNKRELLPVKHDLLVVHAAQHQAYLDRIVYKDHRHFEALSSVTFEH